MAMTNYTLARETPTGAAELPNNLEPNGDYVVAGDPNSPTAVMNMAAPSTTTYLNLLVCREAGVVQVGSTFYLSAVDPNGKTWYFGPTAGYTTSANAVTGITGILP